MTKKNSKSGKQANKPQTGNQQKVTALKYKKEKESCNIAEVNNHIMIRRKCSVISDVDDNDG